MATELPTIRRKHDDRIATVIDTDDAPCKERLERNNYPTFDEALDIDTDE
jgi:hypothetical protein